GGRVERLDTRTGQTQSVDPTLANPGIDRHTWTLPLVFSPRDPRVLYFANQRLFRTDDGGKHWSAISPDLTRENAGAPPNLDAETAYAAIDRQRLDDVRPYVYRTHDGGKTWQLVTDGLTAFVNAVREDPVRRGLLYAGTERGVAVSFDDGDHWQPLQQNLPVTSVRDLDVHGNDVVIATHGRA